MIGAHSPESIHSIFSCFWLEERAPLASCGSLFCPLGTHGSPLTLPSFLELPKWQSGTSKDLSSCASGRKGLVLSSQGAQVDGCNLPSQAFVSLPGWWAWSQGSQTEQLPQEAGTLTSSHSRAFRGPQSSTRGLPIPGLLGFISLAWNLLEQGSLPWAAAPEPHMDLSS